MTERQIANRVKKLQSLEIEQSILAQQIDDLKKEIQAEMQDRERLQACNYIINYCFVVSNRLDTKRIKIDLPDIYSKYTTQTHSRRFSISTL